MFILEQQKKDHAQVDERKLILCIRTSLALSFVYLCTKPCKNMSWFWFHL